MYRVVIADDSDEFVGWLKSVLDSSEDFEVVGVASTGLQACKLAESISPDLVISDVYMPEMDGIELARCIRDKVSSTKVILVSVHEDKVYNELSAETGAISFIPKARLSLGELRKSLQEEV